MKRFLRTTIAGLVLMAALGNLYAQTPTNQDCLGAIPICQTSYFQNNSYVGYGNFQELPNQGANSTNFCPGHCFSTGEHNTVWYTFTTQNAGNLSFLLTPNNASDDYDWAVYNLTNANCTDIYSNSSLQLSCNFCGTSGSTGPNGGSGSNCEGPNSCSPYNATIPVGANQTIAIVIDNFSATQSGYSLNFSSSTASIFDVYPPQFSSVNTGAITCGTNQITFNFSENVLCSTVQACDFQLTGPGGPYTITNITGAGCVAGSPMENTFTMTVSPSISSGGAYTLSLVNGCSSVTDLCGNTAPPNSFNFNVSAPSVSVSPSSAGVCTGGCVTLTASGATSYTWQPGNLSGASQNVCPGTTTTYTVTGISAACTSTASVTVTVNANPTLSASASPASVCAGQCSDLSASGAGTYTWQPGGLSGSPVNVCPGATTTYTVTGANGACTASTTVTLTVNPSPAVTASASPAGICSGSCSDLSAGGAVSYVWQPGNLNGTPVNVCPGTTTTYTVTGTNGSGCTGSASVVLTVNPTPTVGASASPSAICLNDCLNLTGSGASTYNWQPGNLSGSPVNVCPTASTTYTVTGSTAANCTATATVSVTVSPNPSLTASASPSSICTGQNTTLNVNGATTYVWQPGNLSGNTVVVSPAATTTYTVTGTTGSCTASTTVTVTVNPTPVVSITPSNPSICAGQSVQLNVNSTVALTNCTWNPTTFLNPSNSCNPTASPTTTTTYYVMGQTAQNCTNTAMVTINVNPLPLVTISSSIPGNTICNGQCAQLTATSNPPAQNWSWSPGNGLSSTTVFNPNACPSATTTYTATSTTSSGCTGTNSIIITVNPTPVLTASPQPANVCDGGSLQLSVTGVPALAACSWNPSSSLNPPTGSCTPTSTPSATTTYTITGTTAAGCTSTTTLTVNVQPNPVITISPASVTICFGDTTQLQASDNPAQSVTTWAWNPAATLDAGNLASPLAWPGSTTTYTVTGTTAYNCTGSASAVINVNPLPVINFNPLPTLCVSSPAFVMNQATPAGGTYSGPGVSGTNNFSPSVAGAGIHTITYTYTDPVTGCTDSATQTITINTGIPVTVTPNSVFICPADNVTLTASGASTYAWTPQIGMNTYYGPTVVAHPPVSTIYTVTGSNADGCSGSASATVNYYSTAAVTISSDPVSGCAPLETIFTFTPETSVADSTWWWDFGDMYSNLNTSDEKNPTHLFPHEGNFIVTFQAEDINGCEINTSLLMNVFIKPNADFYYNPNVAYTENPAVNFVDYSSGAGFWMWDFGDPASHNYNYSEEKNPTHYFSDSGTYTVTLIVMSSNSCSDTVEHTVTVLPSYLIWIPNAFTPNKDRLNDVFFPVISGIDPASYRFYIFDRWGREVFFTDKMEVGWDGRNKSGKDMAQGVYTYVLYFSEMSTKDHKIVGSFTLIR